MAQRCKRRKRRDDKQRMICAQTVVAGVSVAQVARRYDLNANQIFDWLTASKFSPDDHPEENEAKFLPVEGIAEPTPSEPMPELTGLTELDLVNGHRLQISGRYDPEAMARLVRYLT